jgi:molybdopterin-binding protein
LNPGKEAIALIKAPWITLATEDCGLKFSARNQFAGAVSAVTEGAVNATVQSPQTPVLNSGGSDQRKLRGVATDTGETRHCPD